ncbi:MAG: polyprenyl synthetase family protein, partial [Candidatus Nomurabacteria bacterium]|nr:polyprenyl synthetase family protein [Candidatus Nomurabacteria bacterium]
MIPIKQIEKNRLALQKFLKVFLVKKRKEFKNVSFWSKDIEEKILEFSSSGKMLRGVLLMLSSGKSDKDTLKIASAIELLHSAFLIHDDIMDQDVLRRGKDSMHVRYIKELKFLKGDINHYGLSQAISLGDICIFLAFVLISDLASVHKEKIQAFFINEMIRVGFGQMEDMMVSF